jgi:hypothetical protein
VFATYALHAAKAYMYLIKAATAVFVFLSIKAVSLIGV